MNDYFLIAEVKSTVYDDGYLLLKTYSVFPERFFELDFVFIDIFGVRKKVILEDIKRSARGITIKIKNFNSSDDAKIFLGKQLFVKKNDTVKLDEENYFVHDLLGCKIYNNDMFFGELIDVLQLTSNDVYVVKCDNGREILIPAVLDYIKSINVADKKISLRNAEGIFGDDAD